MGMDDPGEQTSELLNEVVRWVLVVGFLVFAGILFFKDLQQRKVANHNSAPLLTASTADGQLVTLQGTIDPNTPRLSGKLVAYNSQGGAPQVPPLTVLVPNVGPVSISGGYKLIGHLTLGGDARPGFGVTAGQTVSVLGTVSTDAATHQRQVQAQILTPGDPAGLVAHNQTSASNLGFMAAFVLLIAVFLVFVNPFRGFMWFQRSGIFIHRGRPPSNPIEWLTDLLKDMMK